MSRSEQLEVDCASNRQTATTGGKQKINSLHLKWQLTPSVKKKKKILYVGYGINLMNSFLQCPRLILFNLTVLLKPLLWSALINYLTSHSYDAVQKQWKFPLPATAGPRFAHLKPNMSKGSNKHQSRARHKMCWRWSVKCPHSWRRRT